jgi:bifunctional UDP-N-acetylglucosamine pyrophosphorylase/glucosamine-1-phosphate N-acetyltransferase
MAVPVAAVILAAGQGTRMKSTLPKVMHRTCGKPLVAWSVDAARAAGCARVVVVVGHGKAVVEGELRARYGADVALAVQAEQKGTGHAAQMALPALEGHSGTVVILYGDCPLVTPASIMALVELRQRTGARLALWTTRVANPAGYGRIVRGKDGLLDRIVEHKDATESERRIDEINPGVYAVDAAFLRSALSELAPNNAQGELYLTDLVAIARKDGSGGVPTLEVGAEETLGVNDRKQLAEAGGVLKHRVIESAMREGVTFEAPNTVLVDATVRFGIDVVVGPHVVLQGNTAIGEGVRVGAGCVLVDTEVAAGVTLHPYSVCDGAKIATQAIVGPFSRLRPGAVLDAGSHVGNFVEMKKARLGKGSKANHLAYLGDAEIGANTNVGAGTITCNYDGFGKYVTTLGDDVFIGSNSTLVAPVTVHSGAYVAAGSVITEDVPRDALALGRGKQVNKEGRGADVKKRAKERAKKT